MILILVDGDYLLSGMTPSSDIVIRETVERLLAAVGTNLSSSPCSGTVEHRVVLFSTSILKSVGEEGRELLISCLRRLRFQTIILDSIPNRAGSPIDAAMCTRTMSVITKPSTTKYALVYFTANAYISSVLEWAQEAGSEIYFVVYDNDTVADILLAYASGVGVATIPKGEGIKYIPDVEAMSAALAALRADGTDLSLAALQQLRRLQQKARGDSGKGGAPPAPFAPPPAIAGVPNPFEKAPADPAQGGAGGEAAERAFATATATATAPAPTAPTAPPSEMRETKETKGIRVIQITKVTDEAPAEVGALPRGAHIATASSAPGPVAPVAPVAPATQPPAVVGPHASSAPDGLPEPVVSTRLPVGWGLMYDRPRRRHYFVHTESGRTTWAHPGGAAEQMDLERQVEEWYAMQQKRRQSESSVVQTAGANTQIAPSWDECIDAKSGRKYYVNRQTRQTSWTLPNSSTHLAPNPNSIPNPTHIINPSEQTASKAPVGSALPPQWEERVDTKSGRRFYVNHQTHETTWTPPLSTRAAQPIPVSSNTTEPLPPHWEERTEVHTGRKYYVNHQTRETTWTRPAGAFTTPPQEPPLPLPLPPNWGEHVDPKTGGHFYVNHQTRETTWTRPQF